jgi:hypothetical protein
MQPTALVSTPDTGVLSSSRSEVNLADLWPARLELEPLGGDERPGARWWPWAWAILRVSGVVACAWLWSRWYGGVRHVGEQGVGLTLGQDDGDRTGRRSSTPSGSPYRCPHPRGRYPALRGTEAEH